MTRLMKLVSSNPTGNKFFLEVTRSASVKDLKGLISTFIGIVESLLKLFLCRIDFWILQQI